MTLLGAFLIGYFMGTRAGEEGMKSLLDAGTKVVQSDEFKSTVAGVTSMARGALVNALDANRESGSKLRVA